MCSPAHQDQESAEAIPKHEAKEIQADALSVGRVILVVGPAYGVLAFSVFVSWKLRSASALVAVAAMAAALAGVMGGVGVLKAKSAWMHLEARTIRRKPLKKKNNKNLKSRKRAKVVRPEAPPVPVQPHVA